MMCPTRGARLDWAASRSAWGLGFVQFDSGRVRGGMCSAGGRDGVEMGEEAIGASLFKSRNIHWRGMRLGDAVQIAIWGCR